MQEDHRFFYHISLIESRWFEEKMQDDNLSDKVAREECVWASTKKIKNAENGSSINPGLRVQNLNYPPEPVIGPDKHSKKRYADVVAATREIADELANTTATEEEFKSVMEKIEEIKDSMRASRNIKNDTRSKDGDRQDTSMKSSRANSGPIDLFKGIPVEAINDGEL
ncbi:hypothetical protein BGW38_002658 [Lunasporangiospora selenospora]|uniref:Uncharacterized protein n=1 Tax=Lunasporangiospora selenospora TaxID=979761 RepID=A0A9P6FRR5_9FUNG|nr:hypothetical protein BGW38_002658 [Lunasporangiospora selenospora]